MLALLVLAGGAVAGEQLAASTRARPSWAQHLLLLCDRRALWRLPPTTTDSSPRRRRGCCARATHQSFDAWPTTTDPVVDPLQQRRLNNNAAPTSDRSFTWFAR